MQDDFTVFWRNDKRASELFYDLLARSERAAYDDDFLAVLAAYRMAAPESERADIFAAQYLLHHDDAESAALCGERAFQKRPVNYEVWKVLAPAYEQTGRELDALIIRAYCHNLYKDPLPPLRLTHTPTAEALAYPIEVVKSDVFTYLDRSLSQYDVIFADPPYDIEADSLERLIETVFERNLLSEDGLLIVEHSSKVHLEEDPHFQEERRYGGTTFSIFNND